MSASRTDHVQTRREFLAAVSTAWMGGLAYTIPSFAQAQQPPVTSFKALRGGVGIFTGRGGTIGWFISEDAIGVVDSQYPDTAKICLDGITQRAGYRPIECLMITHHHGDHTAGNGIFRPTTRRILAHEKVPELMRNAAAQQKTENQQIYPDSTFTDVWVVELAKEKARMEHFGPAHTGGDAVVFFEKANVAHMGDLVFNRRHPFIDKPAGASIAGWITTLETVAKKFSGDTVYVYGHAQQGWDVTGRSADLLYQRDYLSALLEYVRTGIKAGKSREAIVGVTEPLKGFPDHGPLSERVLDAAYQELTA